MLDDYLKYKIYIFIVEHVEFNSRKASAKFFYIFLFENFGIFKKNKEIKTQIESFLCLWTEHAKNFLSFRLLPFSFLLTTPYEFHGYMKPLNPFYVIYGGYLSTDK